MAESPRSSPDPRPAPASRNQRLSADASKNHAADRSGKKVILFVLATIVAVAGTLFYFGVTGGSQHVPGSAPGVGFGAPSATVIARKTEADAATAFEKGSITRTIQDRRVRDELRRRILAGWAQGDGEGAEAARQGRVPTMPELDGGIDPTYIRNVVRSEFMPLAGKCYEELLSRKDAGGNIVMKFKIVADEKLGGLVEDADIENDGGLYDERMSECLRESLLGMAFAPPPRGGWITVEYPIAMSPSDPDE